MQIINLIATRYILKHPQQPRGSTLEFVLDMSLHYNLVATFYIVDFH